MAKTTIDNVTAKFVRTVSAGQNRATRPEERLPRRRIKVKSSAHPPVEMKLRVHFKPAKDQPLVLDPKKPGAVKPPVSDLLKGLDPQDEEFLRKMEPDLLTWIHKHDKNAARFFANPVSALKEAGFKVTPKLLQKIKRIRRTSMLDRPALPQAHLTELVFKK